ncbi:MAG: nucleolar RNA-binding Nop10p family protein [Candidatus Thalassarchaeaceae archaeon]|jgi:rRNA maturation protein Nop10|nr:nucleolar RNA-binding Nop10p family protein [Candidatus Thalassarchaeaceae archaeon]
MARTKLQKCTACGEYGLSETCKECGGKAQAAGPMKFSPEDSRAHLRRRLKNVESKEWVESLPSPDGGEEE